MPRTRSLIAAAVAVAALPLAGADAHGGGPVPGAFQHAGTFSVPANLLPGEPIDTVTSAEITDVSPDGRTLVSTDSPAGRLGFVDIRDAKNPKPQGILDVGGEPTSVAIKGDVALVAVNTSPSFVAPSGDLVVVNLRTHHILRRIPLAGQPDSIAISPDRRWAAIVIENERDEDADGGLIPQSPPGTLQVLDLKRLFAPLTPSTLRTVDLTGIAAIAPDDPEPEFVDINRRNQAVVSLQENNHLAVIDLRKAKILRHFSAGSATLTGVDATEEELGPQGAGLIALTDTIIKRREPDAVHWIDDDTFATANEGDYEDAAGEEGGSRGFTLFNRWGGVEYESGASFEREVVRAGHFPQARAANKGIEPEGLEFAVIGGRKLLFVGAERANVVGVYDVGHGTPRLLQILPTGIGPEGLRAVPSRGLLAVSAETDGKADGFDVRSIVTLYRVEAGAPKYPSIISADDETGSPIPWTALSGLSGDPSDRTTLWTVSDSALAQSSIYEIDVSGTPAVIRRRIAVGGVGVTDQATGDFDLEGIVARREGGFWLASEGRTNVGSSRPNLLVRAAPDGTVLTSVPLPASLVAGATSSGFEGVTVTGTEAGGDETVYVAIQREWADDAPGFVKLGRYVVATGEWTFVSYPLDAVASPSGGWVGLSEITLAPNGHHASIIERDDRIGLDAAIKRIYAVDLTDPSVAWKPHGETLDVISKTLVKDMLGTLDAASISIPDKLEGFGITADGKPWYVTDNDGNDENYGETLFGRL